MPTTTFHNLKKEKKRVIIDAALKEFGRHDYEHINIQNIIKDAHIPRGSFYQYFNDLDDLFDYLTEMITTEKLAYFKAHGELSEQAPFFDRLGELYRLGFQFAQEYPLFFQASKHMIKPALKRLNFEARLEYIKTELINDQTYGTISQDVDLDMLANVLLLFLTQQMESHFIEQRLTLTDVDQRFERFIKLLKKGITNHV